VILASLLAAVITIAAATPTSWLDASAPRNWNTANATLPSRPGVPDLQLVNGGRCADGVRPATSPEDRMLVARGWKLVGPYQRYGPTVIVSGMAGADGMCRPEGYQVFVFVNGAFAGTLSPKVMNSREDASLNDLSVPMYSATSITTNFARYTPDDPLCCASRTTNVTYQIKTIGGRPRVVPTSAITQKNGQ
jgi:hypothetical protein